MNEPSWLTIARRYVGIREAPGATDNPTILGWAKRMGARVLGMGYQHDSTPWCGLFVSEVMTEAGITPPPISVRASAWDSWGVACQPCLGAVVRFQRPGGGHVAILTGESATQYRVLGGNQGDRVCETLVDKSRTVAVRWPTGVANLLTPLPLVGGKGQTTSFA